MPKLDANQFRLRIESATPGTFNEIAGQRELSHDESYATYSIATKGDAVDVNGVGLGSHQITLAYVPDLPDANGHTRLSTLISSKSTINVQIWRLTGTPGAVYQCAMVATGFPKSYPFNDAVGVQVTLVPAAQPSVNALSA